MNVVTRQSPGLRKLSWWHDALIDDMLANPLDTLAQRSARLGYTVPWLSTVINSDMFQAAYQARKLDINNALKDAITIKLSEAAHKSLDLLVEQLEKKRDNIPFADLSASTTNILDRLGFAPSKAGTAVQVNVNAPQATVSAEALGQARDRLRQHQQMLAQSPPATPSTTDASPLVDESGESLA